MQNTVRIQRDDVLQHHGVKDMHWGVWNAETAARYAGRSSKENKQSNKKDGKIAKYETKLKNAAKRMDDKPTFFNELRAINAAEKYVKKKKTPISIEKQHQDDMSDLLGLIYTVGSDNYKKSQIYFDLEVEETLNKYSKRHVTLNSELNPKYRKEYEKYKKQLDKKNV